MSRKYKFHNPEGLYFVSFAIVHWIDVLTRREYQQIILDSLNHCQEHKGMELFAWCIMTNHIHLMYRTELGQRPENILRDMKKYTSSKLLRAVSQNPIESRKEWMLRAFKKAGEGNSNNTHYQFWRQNNKPIELFSNKVIDQKLDYIHNNPVEVGFVDEPHKYRLSSAIDYAGGKGILDIAHV